jgi:hypothetical protein
MRANLTHRVRGVFEGDLEHVALAHDQRGFGEVVSAENNSGCSFQF